MSCSRASAVRSPGCGLVWWWFYRMAMGTVWRSASGSSLPEMLTHNTYDKSKIMIIIPCPTTDEAPDGYATGHATGHATRGVPRPSHDASHDARARREPRASSEPPPSTAPPHIARRTPRTSARPACGTGHHAHVHAPPRGRSMPRAVRGLSEGWMCSRMDGASDRPRTHVTGSRPMQWRAAHSSSEGVARASNKLRIETTPPSVSRA